MAKRYQRGNQKPYITGQILQSPKDKKDKRTNNDLQNTTQKTKNRASTNPTTNGD